MGQEYFFGIKFRKLKNKENSIGFPGTKKSQLYRQVFIIFMADKTCKTLYPFFSNFHGVHVLNWVTNIGFCVLHYYKLWVEKWWRRDPKYENNLLNTRRDNVQNFVVVLKCEKPYHWLNAPWNACKNVGPFRRHNRHYGLHMKTCKPPVNGAR